MAELNITADPEAINKWLAEQILNSGIGEVLRKQAGDALKDYSFTRAIKETVSNMVLNEARNLVQNDPQFRARVAAEVVSQLTPQLITEIVTKGLQIRY